MGIHVSVLSKRLATLAQSSLTLWCNLMLSVQEGDLRKKKKKSLDLRITFEIAQPGENSYVDNLVSWVLVFFFNWP